MLTRDDFAKRHAAGNRLFMHECLYPIMQAWDSVVIKSDIELGGTEQLYSLCWLAICNGINRCRNRLA